MTKDELVLTILSVVLAHNYDTQVTSPEIARIAQDIADEMWPVLNKMSKSKGES